MWQALEVIPEQRSCSNSYGSIAKQLPKLLDIGIYSVIDYGAGLTISRERIQERYVGRTASRDGYRDEPEGRDIIAASLQEINCNLHNCALKTLHMKSET